MNVSTSYYLKTVHGGHKVVLENDKVLIAEKTLSFKDFKAVYGKNPLNYFEDKKNECKLKGLISIFDVIKGPINKAIDNIPRFIKKKLGIDVEAKYQDIKSIFYRHFAPICFKNKVDAEEVLQEVYYGLEIRNRGTCPFDPAKSSMSTYIVLVARGVVFNYLKKTKKSRENEKVSKTEDDRFNYIPTEEKCIDEDIIHQQMKDLFKGDMANVFEDMTQGYSIKEISKRQNLEPQKVNQIKDRIKKIIEPRLRGEV
jgi:RNA polymerase sigma factor (sigma-70 family)